MSRRVRRLLILGVAAGGLWTLRRVMVNRAGRRTAQGTWPSDISSAPAALDGTPATALPAAPIISELAALGSTGTPARVATGPAKAKAITPLQVVEGDGSDRPPAPAVSPMAPAESPSESDGPPEPDTAAPEPAGPTTKAPPANGQPANPTPAKTTPAKKAAKPAPARGSVPPAAATTTGPEGGNRLDTDNLDRVRRRLASIRVDVPPVRGVAASFEVDASVRSRTTPRAQSWHAPTDDGTCPQDFPIKAKLRSKLFHLPGMLVYDRTKADRCYAKPEDAETDGFTRAKR